MTAALRLIRLLLVLAVLLPGTGRAQPEPELGSRALAQYGRGVVLFNAHDYPAAAAAFRAAYAAEPRREFLFAWAQAARLGGDCKTAVPLYRKLLDAGPPPSQAEMIRASLARCASGASSTATPPPGQPPLPDPLPDVTRAPAVAPARRPGVAPATAPAVVAPVMTTRAQPGRPWYRDPLGGALVAGGVVAVAAGVGLFVTAWQADRTAGTQSIYREFASYSDQARARRVAGWATLGVGGALLVAGVLRYALRGRWRQRVAAGWQLDLREGRVAVVWR